MNAEHIKSEWSKGLARVDGDRLIHLIGEQSAYREDAEGRAARLRKAGATVAAERAEESAQLHAELREMAVRAYYDRMPKAS